MFIFYEFRPFYIDNARVIYRKIRYILFVRFDYLTAKTIKIVVFCDVTPCSMVKV